MRDVVRSPRTQAAAAAFALLLGLTACASSEPEPAAGDSSASAVVESPTAAGDDGPTSEAAQSSGDGTWDQDTIAEAMLAAAAEQETAHFRSTTRANGGEVEAEGDLSFGPAMQDMVMVVDGAAFGGERMEMRVVDRVVYLSMPPMTPKGKFIEIKPGDDSPFAAMTEQMVGNDPVESLRIFQEGLTAVEFVGVETVDGEELERYRFTMDSRAVARSQGLPAKGLPKTVEYDVWLDSDALTRRMEFDLEQVSMVMEYSDWGEPVTIAAPRKNQIVEMPGR